MIGPQRVSFENFRMHTATVVWCGLERVELTLFNAVFRFEKDFRGPELFGCKK